MGIIVPTHKFARTKLVLLKHLEHYWHIVSIYYLLLNDNSKISSLEQQKCIISVSTGQEPRNHLAG